MASRRCFEANASAANAARSLLTSMDIAVSLPVRIVASPAEQSPRLTMPPRMGGAEQARGLNLPTGDDSLVGPLGPLAFGVGDAALAQFVWPRSADEAEKQKRGGREADVNQHVPDRSRHREARFVFRVFPVCQGEGKCA